MDTGLPFRFMGEQVTADVCGRIQEVKIQSSQLSHNISTAANRRGGTKMALTGGHAHQPWTDLLHKT